MLRIRMLLSLSVFLILLVGLGMLATVLLFRMADQVDAAVAGNYRSLLLAESMRQELDLLERDLWATTPSTNTSAVTLNQVLKQFEQNLVTLTNSAAAHGELATARKLGGEFNAFAAALTAFRAEQAPDSRREIYQLRVTPSILALDQGLEQVRDLNDRAIVATPATIESISRNITGLLTLGLAMVLLVSGYVFYRIGRSILHPIEALTRATRELGNGTWQTPVPIVSQDELGELTQSFNAMASQLQAYRRSTSDEIMRLHRTMESTLASFPDPIFVLDRAGRIELMNPAARSLAHKAGFGDELPGPLRDIAEGALASNKNFLPHSFAEGLSFRTAKSDRFFLPRALIMRDKDQQLFGVAVVLNDVTRFRLLDAAKTNLVATVSHELKTPLTGLTMALHLVADRTVGALLPQQEELLQAARQDADRLLRILNDLLDLAKLDAGNAGLNRVATAPAELVRTAVSRFVDSAAEQRVSLTGSAPSDLPQVLADPQRIDLVFSNLLSNAIKHTPPGGKVTMTASASTSDCVEFAVSDTGPGIPEEYHIRIFDRFFRVPKQEKTGAGLGLSIAREIVVAHGGRIGVRSTPGKGSTFFVMLPAS